METTILPTDLEQFATDAVTSGRFGDRNEVLAAGVELLRRNERLRVELLASVLAAQADGEENGFLTIDEVMRDMDAVIEEMARSKV